MSDPCPHTKPSQLIEGHDHTCNGAHMDDLHKCSDPSCRRWFA